MLDRTEAAAFSEAFADRGVFVRKTVKGRRYWYFQIADEEGRRQRYVGPETPELLKRIERHELARSDLKDRRSLVAALIREGRLPRPLPEIGNVVAALSQAGVFRLRGVLVGTVAYQAYSAMLAVRLPVAALQTSGVDIAQFSDVSVAIGDRTLPMLEVLRSVDPSFRQVPSLRADGKTASYRSGAGVRVDFLTPNRGPESETPRRLPALGTDAQPLRFLDFLIRDPEPAVLLHAVGVLVQVPAPERYALHKLIVARRRTLGAAKSDKDVAQAEALFPVLAHKRLPALQAAWHEAVDRGPRWRRALTEGLGMLASEPRDNLLRALGEHRSIVPDLDLRFTSSTVRYDDERDVVEFWGEAAGARIRCVISREAMEDHFKADDLDRRGRLRRFRENRDTIEQLACQKYLHRPVEEANALTIRSEDVRRLRQSKS